MAAYLPCPTTQVSAILTFDKWFDLFNSRVPLDARAGRCGFDVREGANVAQTATLQAAEHLIRESQKYLLCQNWEGSPQPAAVPCAPLSPWPVQRAVLCPEGAVSSDVAPELGLCRKLFFAAPGEDVRPQPDARLCGCWVNDANDYLLRNNVQITLKRVCILNEHCVSNMSLNISILFRI